MVREGREGGYLFDLTSRSNLTLTGPEDDSVVAVSAKEKKKKHKRKCPPEPLRPSPSPELPDSQESAQEGDMLEMGVASLEMGGATLLVGGAPDSLSSSPSMLSVSSTAEEGEPPIFVALDTSSDPASSEAEAAASATALVLSATSQHSAQVWYRPLSACREGRGGGLAQGCACSASPMTHHLHSLCQGTH